MVKKCLNEDWPLMEMFRSAAYYELVEAQHVELGELEDRIYVRLKVRWELT